MPFVSWITGAEFAEAVPIIISLILIEGLLSVDNALAIAAMANHLPEKQKYLALRLGILGAYVFRGVALALASFIIENPWLKIIGAAYLIYLMCRHFTGRDHGDGPGSVSPDRGFWGTIVAIEIMDLSLSVDNVVAAVALSPKLWVVCTGVFIGILALRFVAGACIKLLEKYPVFEHTAFLLIGYVGFILVAELTVPTGSETLPPQPAASVKAPEAETSVWQVEGKVPMPETSHAGGQVRLALFADAQPGEAVGHAQIGHDGHFSITVPSGGNYSGKVTRYIHISPYQKFIGIVVIVAFSLGFSRYSWLRGLFGGLLKITLPLMKLVTLSVGAVIHVILVPFKLLMGVSRRQPPVPGEG